MKEIHLEAEQDNRILQNLLARKSDTALYRLRPSLLRKEHPKQDAEHRTAHNRKVQPQNVRRDCKEQGVEDTVHIFAFHKHPSLNICVLVLLSYTFSPRNARKNDSLPPRRERRLLCFVCYEFQVWNCFVICCSSCAISDSVRVAAAISDMEAACSSVTAEIFDTSSCIFVSASLEPLLSSSMELTAR